MIIHREGLMRLPHASNMIVDRIILKHSIQSILNQSR